MSLKRKQREELKKILKNISKEEGFKCYICIDENYCYGYILTPLKNVLSIQQSMNYQGWTLSFLYVPNKITGSSCACLDNPISNVSKKVVLDAESKGYIFALELKAPLYKDAKKRIEDNSNRIIRIV